MPRKVVKKGGNRLKSRKFCILRKGSRKKFNMYGILFSRLLPSQRELLMKERYLRYAAGNKQLLYIVFRILEKEQVNKYLRKEWFNPYTQEISRIGELEKSSTKVDWTCALCDKPIKSDMERLSPENLCCDKCKPKAVLNDIVNKRIVEASVEFTFYCKKLLFEEQKRLKKFIINERRKEIRNLVLQSRNISENM
jgi:hypothetical protein